VKTNMVNAGVDQIHRDLILGHSPKGMDVHCISPSEDDFHRALAKYTAWLDKEMEFVSHLVNKHEKGANQ